MNHEFNCLGASLSCGSKRDKFSPGQACAVDEFKFKSPNDELDPQVLNCLKEIGSQSGLVESSVGIDAQGLNLMAFAHKRNPFGPTVTLGRQCLHVRPGYLNKMLGKKFEFRHADYCESLLKEHFGATVVDSVDASAYEGASIIHDMNLPVSGHESQYSTVLDFGTLEHIFHVPTALRNIWQMCALGGQILHAVPANNLCGHGFWQFSPELFFSLYRKENGFSDTAIFLARPNQPNVWYRVSEPRNGQRVNVRTLGQVYVLVRTVKTGVPPAKLVVQQSDYIDVWSKSVDSSAQGSRNIFSGSAVSRKLSQFYRENYWRMTGLHPFLKRERVPQTILA